jgi:hypothetical protein
VLASSALSAIDPVDGMVPGFYLAADRARRCGSNALLVDNPSRLYDFER